jgi:3-keto-5-aminohexanoate cleavage enzyme
MAPDTKPQALPLIMVAPNGARRTKVDHPALPMSITETVEAAVACFEAGAGAIHAHVRDENGAHVLDKDLYQALLSELNAALPQMQVQITTEAVGKYTPDDQRKLVQESKCRHWCRSLCARWCRTATQIAAAEFYSWALKEGISVQHILYSAEDLDRFFDLVENGSIPGITHQVLLVLGRYADNQESAPEDLHPFLDRLKARRGDHEIDWGVCAFGHRETECLVYAIENGGKARIGFENGLWNRDGAVAKDNADRVRDLVSALEEKNISVL